MSLSEEKILSTWLLVPASLQSTMTLGAFTRLFPTSQANNPLIRRLYRDLQHQRASLVDSVEKNIEAEAARGNAQKRSVLKVRRGPEKEEQDEEVDIEYAVHGSTSNLPNAKPHTLSSIIPDLELSEEDLEADIKLLEEEVDKLMDKFEAIAGDLSDLRYGKLERGAKDAIMDGLKAMQAFIERCE